MKRKRVHERERDSLAEQKLNLMTSEATLNQLRFTNVVVSAQERVAAAIEREVKKVGKADGVASVQDRLEDAMADARDIVDEATRPIGETHDDSELLEELEQLELAAELQSVVVDDPTPAEAKGATPGVQPLPVPRTNPSGASSSSDAAAAREEREAARELAELVALKSSMKMEAPMAMPMMAMAF